MLLAGDSKLYLLFLCDLVVNYIDSLMKNWLKIFFVCLLSVLLVSCATEKKPLTERQQEMVEEQAMKQWENAQRQIEVDGYGKYNEDGSFTWKKKVKNEKLKVLNRKQLKKPEAGEQKSDDGSR